MMLVEKRLNSRHTQAGITLIELMISIVLGLLLLGAATAMTVSNMVMNADTLKSARLNQDLDSVLQIMVNDIRRAGYTGGQKVLDLNGTVIVFGDQEDLNIVSNVCVLYAYDANENGTLDDTDKFGFKLDGAVIEMRTACDAGDNCTTDCGDNVGNWVALTDENFISIEPHTDLTLPGLSFNSVNSKCLNFSDPENENVNAYWVTTEESTIEFPCKAVDKTDLVNYVSDDSGDFPAPGDGVVGTVAPPLEGDILIESRQVNVVIEAELANDSSMIKRQVVAINVRNNRITVTPP